MNSAQAGMQFPVIGFTPDRDNWGFKNLEDLTTCGPLTLRNNMQDGMELFDCGCRRWRVRSIRRTGRTGSWLMMLLTAKPQSRIEHELEPLPALSLSEVKQRTRESLEAHAINYKGFPGDEEEFATMLDGVQRASSISEILETIGADTFESY